MSFSHTQNHGTALSHTLSCDPAGSPGEGLELGKEGYIARTRIYFLLFISVPLHPHAPQPIPWDVSLMSTLENGDSPDVGEGFS